MCSTLEYQGLNEYNNELRVTWTILSLCNYKCEYCIKPIPNIKFVSKANIDRIVSNLKKLNFNKYKIVITGGEPTLHPNILYLLEHVKNSLNAEIKIITNGSGYLGLYKNILDMGIGLDFSVHFKYFNIKRLHELVAMQNYNKQLTVMLMFYPFYFDKIRDVNDLIISGNYFDTINYDIVFLRKPPTFDCIIDYSKENIEWYKENSQHISVNLDKDVIFKYNDKEVIIKDTNFSSLLLTPDLLNFNGMYCISSFNVIQIYIDNFFTGLLCNHNAATPSNFLHCNKLEPKILLCDIPNCLCSTNLQIPKFHKEEQAKDFLNNYNSECAFNE